MLHLSALQTVASSTMRVLSSARCTGVRLYTLRIKILFCQPRVEVTSCFVDKVIGPTRHDRINTQLIYRIAVAQLVTRRITKPQRTFFRFESHWLLFFIHFFFSFFWGGGGWRSYFIILFMSYLFLFLFIIIFYFLSFQHV